MQRHLLLARWLILGLLPSASSSCQLQSGTEHVFDCMYDGVLAPPDIQVPSWGAGSSFKIYLQLSQLTGFNTSACEELEVAALVGYSSNYVALSEPGKMDQGTCGIKNRHHVLYCLEAATPTSHLTININVESNHHAPVELIAELQQTEMQHDKTIRVGPVGGSYGPFAFHVFAIPDDPKIDLWRVNLAAYIDNTTGPESDAREAVSVYLIPESSPCVSGVVTRGGCFDPEVIETCIGSVPVSFLPTKAITRVAMHLSFTTRGAMTLSKGSIPHLQPGKWIMFVICGDSMRPCPATTVEVQSWGDSHLWMRLCNGVLIILLGTLLVLFAVNTLYWFAYYLLYQCSTDTNPHSAKQRLWPVMFGQCRKSHVRGLGDIAKLIAWPIPFFATFLSLMLGVFLATTAQFVLANYLIMVESGNRDVCFFNERCGVLSFFFPPGALQAALRD